MQRRAGAAVGCARQCAAGPVWLCGGVWRCVAVCGLSVRASALRCTHDTEDKLMLLISRAGRGSRGALAFSSGFREALQNTHTLLIQHQCNKGNCTADVGAGCGRRASRGTVYRDL